MTRVSLFFTICLAASSVHAAAVNWSDLPQVLRGKTIEVKTTDGEVHRGRFLLTSDDSLTIKEQGTNTIKRTAIASIFRNERTHGQSHLSHANENVSAVLEVEVLALDTPYLPLAIAALPVTLVIGAVMIPASAFWDLFDRPTTMEWLVIRDLNPGVAP
jgi:hypothetical protein